MSRVGSMSLLFARQCNAFNSGKAMTSSVFMKNKNSDVSSTNSYCTKVKRQCNKIIPVRIFYQTVERIEDKIVDYIRVSLSGQTG